MIDKIFKILPLKEDLDKGVIVDTDFTIYLNRLIVEFSGILESDENAKLKEVVSIIKGIKIEYKNLKQEEVKSLVFHCISLVK
jgi:hypothetical protein